MPPSRGPPLRSIQSIARVAPSSARLANSSVRLVGGSLSQSFNEHQLTGSRSIRHGIQLQHSTNHLGHGKGAASPILRGCKMLEYQYLSFTPSAAINPRVRPCLTSRPYHQLRLQLIRMAPSYKTSARSPRRRTILPLRSRSAS